MPTIDDRPRTGTVRSAAVVVVLALSAGACAPMKNPPAPTAAAAAPIKVEPLPGPIALAPSFTGTPVAASSPPAQPTPAVADEATAVNPVPVPAAAAATRPAAPIPAAAVATSAPAPVAPEGSAPVAGGGLPQCPPGTIAMWSQPDVVGTRVGICHALQPPR